MRKLYYSNCNKLDYLQPRFLWLAKAVGKKAVRPEYKRYTWLSRLKSCATPRWMFLTEIY